MEKQPPRDIYGSPAEQVPPPLPDLPPPLPGEGDRSIPPDLPPVPPPLPEKPGAVPPPLPKREVPPPLPEREPEIVPPLASVNPGLPPKIRLKDAIPPLPGKKLGAVPPPLPKKEVPPPLPGKDPEAGPTAMPAGLSPENVAVLNKLPSGPRNLVSRLYESVQKIPGIGWAVGKMGIAYNNFWANRHEMKAAKMKSQMDGLDMGMRALDDSKAQMKSVLKDLNMPGDKVLEVKMKEIDMKKNELMNRKDKVQSSLEARVNKTKLYTEKRDKIADTLIERYTGILSPLEKKMGGLSESRDELDVLVISAEAKLEVQNEKIRDIESKRDKLEKGLRDSGLSAREIKGITDGSFGFLEKQLSDCKKTLKGEFDDLSRRRFDVNSKVTKLDGKMATYRDKKDQFIRVKSGRPIDMEVKPRSGATNKNYTESTQANMRTGSGEAPVDEVNPASVERELGKEGEQNSVESYLVTWNKYCTDKLAGGKIYLIDQVDFLRKTRLNKANSFKPDSFKKILASYLKLKKIPASKSEPIIRNFDKIEG